MAELSKIKVNGLTYDLKDATARANLTTLLGGHAVSALGDAAWLGVDSSVTAGGEGVVTGGAIKTYVDNAIATIHNFDIVICEADATKIPAGAHYIDSEHDITGTMAASADTMYKIYMVKNTRIGTGAYAEYLTLRHGAGTTEDPYTYSWEMIGSTVVDLSDYVKKTTTIAGVAINDGIAKSDLQAALELNTLAYCSEGKVTISTADSITMDSYTPAGTITVSTSESTAAASLTKGNYTPAGNIMVGSEANKEVLVGGSINVTVKDATEATAVTNIEYENYTPAGAINVTSESVLKSASFVKSDAGIAISGTINKPAVNVTSSSETFVKSLKAGDVAAASFTEGAFTPAAISDGFFSAGSYTEGTLSQGELPTINTKPTSAFNTDGIKASVDSETLVFEAAATANALTDVTLNAGTLPSWNSGSYTAPSIDATKFSGGSKAADTFAAQNLPVVDETANALVTASAALAAAPEFTGDKFTINTDSGNVIKTAEFAGTAAAVKFKGAKYLKQEINAASFTPVQKALSFAGTERENILVTGVNYDRVSVNSAQFTGTAATLTGSVNKSDKTVNVVFD